MIDANNQGARIEGIDYALPSRRVTNADLAKLHPGWQMDQVALRTGVLERCWCTEAETGLDLAEAASRKIMARLNLGPDDLDAVLFCTQSPDHVMPPNACLLQSRLGLATSVAALDFSLACSGFIYGLYLARALVTSGSAKRVLLVTAETYSKWMHMDDRGPSTLFGDGAAATIISAGRSGIGPVMTRTDGRGGPAFMVPAGGARQPCSAQTCVPVADPSGNIRTAENIYMDGGAVLDFVKKEIPGFVRTLLEASEGSIETIDLAIFHQGSQMTLDLLHKALRIPVQKQFSNLAKIGNTVSASIPMAIRDAELAGVLKPGMQLLVTGFGVGLSWGGCLLNW